MFKLMDTDNDGKVSYDELKAGLQKVGSQLAEPEMKMLMEVVNSYFYWNSDSRLQIDLCLFINLMLDCSAFTPI